MTGPSDHCRALLCAVLAVLLAGQVAKVEAQQCDVGHVNINVTRYGPLVLECQGNFRSIYRLGKGNVLRTQLNAEGVTTSWLIYENVTTSNSFVRIRCYTHRCGTKYYSIKIFAPPSNVSITDSGLTASTVAFSNSATLNCSASGTDPLQYKWYYRRRPVYWYSRTLIPGANATTYTVYSAEFSDAGEYTCEVSNWAGKDQGMYTLNVQTPPSNVRITDSGLTSNTVRLRTTTTLTCSASGTSPQYQWKHNGTVIPGAKYSTYTVYSVGFSDAGQYTCEVSNWVGSHRGTYTLKVQAHPVPVTITDSGLISKTVGLEASATLYCSSPATSPHYQWSHNSSNIFNATSSWYTVSSANFTDAGQYTCRVSNLVGTGYGSYQLVVQAQPTIAEMNTSSPSDKVILPKRGLGSTSVNIYCTANGDANPVTFKWTLNGGTVRDSTASVVNQGNKVVGHLLISPVRPAHRGTYRCFTRNRVGSDYQELYLTVVEPPMIVAIQVNDSNAAGVIYARSGTKNKFYCVVSGEPPLSTSWELQTTGGEINRVGSTFPSILTHDDEGTYTCTVVNEEERLSDNATVVVKVYDPITLTSPALTELEHNEKAQVALRCSFFKDPDDPDAFPQVTWNGPSVSTTTHSATQTTPNNYESVFTFTATRHHHGQFTCSVNDVGVGTISATFQSTVYYPPTGVVLQATPASVNNGTSTTIHCTGHSRPPPKFTITRRLADGTESMSFGDTFLLQPSSRKDLGYNSLTCSATNSKYSTPVLSNTRSILIRGAPDIVDSNSIHSTGRSFTSVSVQWTTPQNNFDAIRNYEFKLGECETSGHSSSPCRPVRTQQSSSNSPFHTLENLRPFTTYRLEMAAYNSVGRGPYSNAVVVKTVQQDEATVKNFAALHQGNTRVLFQWHAPVNLTQAGTTFRHFRLTRLRQGFSDDVNTLTLRAAQCPNSDMTEFCHEWEGFAAGASYSVRIEMVYSYPATGGRVGLTVTIPVVESNSIKVISRSFTSVTVQWRKPHDSYGEIRYYQFKLGECETSDHSSSPCRPVRHQQYRSSANSLYHTFENLSPFTAYSLEMAAFSGTALGPYSNAVVVQTVQKAEATVKNFTAFHQGDTKVLFQWHAPVNLTQDGTAFSYFRLTRLSQGFPQEMNITLSALCSNSVMTEFCHEWEGFAAGANYSVWIEMVYSYPATGGRVGLTVTIPAVPTGVPLVAVVAGGAGAGLLAILLILIIAIIPIIVAVRRSKRRKRVKEPKNNTEGEEDETNCSSTEKSNEYRYATNIAAKSNESTVESAMLDQARAMIVPTMNTSNPYQPLDVEGVAQCSPYASYNIGQSALLKCTGPESAMLAIAEKASCKDDKIHSSQEGGARAPNSDNQHDPDYAIPSEALAEYTAAENIYMEPDVDIVEECSREKVAAETTKSTTTEAPPPKSGKKKKKAPQSMSDKGQTPPSTSPKPQCPKQPKAGGANCAASETTPQQQCASQVSESPASTSPKPQHQEQTSAPLQQRAPQVSEGQNTKPQPKPKGQSIDAPAAALKRSASAAKPPQRETPAQQIAEPPKPQYPKQPTASDTSGAASATSPLQQCTSQNSEAPASISPKPQYPKQPSAPPLQRVPPVSEGQNIMKPQPKPKTVDAPTAALRRSASAAKPPHCKIPAQQIVESPSSMPERQCMQPSHGGDCNVDGTVLLKACTAGPIPPQVALKGTPTKPECKTRIVAKTPQSATSAMESSPLRSEGSQKIPPTPAVRPSLLPPATSARQMKPTEKPQGSSTAEKLSVVERARLLEKIM